MPALSGLAFYRGIPGSIGGALRMNAGAHGRETKDVLVEAHAVDRQGNTHVLSLADMKFSYRHCGVPHDWIFTEAVYQGTPGDTAEILKQMGEVAEYREANQPIKERTGGSTFKNPPGSSAWKLIDAAGCRGFRVGGAKVSDMHCNFLINDRNASGEDIERLGETVRARVKDKSRRDVAVGNHSARVAGRRPAHGRGTRGGVGAMSASSGSRRFNHVAVLMGGLSAEREVSLNSGKACADALESAGYKVTRVDAGRDLADQLRPIKPEVCFNALHGRWGEDGCVQGVLELLGIPYTHSGVLASALAMHKERAKEVMRAAGIPVAEGKVVAQGRGRQEPRAAAPLRAEARLGRLQRRRVHRARGPRSTRRRSSTIRAGRSAKTCWRSASFPVAS